MSEEMNGMITGFIAVGAFILGLMGGCIIMAKNNNTVQRLQIDAVKHGVAHWKVNEDGTTIFEWNK